jgi:penicillin-binding protein 1A
MDMILAKILAVVLALSQISTRPDTVKTHFAPSDRAEVVALLRAGCAHVRKVFEIEDLQLDDLVETAMSDPGSLATDAKTFRGVNFADLNIAYRRFCKNEDVESPAIDIAKVIEFYNSSAADLPDHARLKGLRLPGPTVVLDDKGRHFAELYEAGNRRIWVPLADIPAPVQQAFIAAEDKRFYQHHGIDERGLVRAFVSNMMQPGRPQGGSTITQQVVKNLLVGDDVTYERKIREILVTSRLEHTLTKPEILELYLNSIYLGRNSWGVEMAAKSFFGKSARDLDLTEGALLAGLTKGPNYFSPDRAPDRARERYAYVLTRLQEDGLVDAERSKTLQGEWPRFVPYVRTQPAAPYFFDYLSREAKSLPGLAPFKTVAYTVRSTIDTDLQAATEAALQEGLAQYEMSTGRVSFEGPETNLGNAVKALSAEAPAGGGSAGSPLPLSPPAWQRALSSATLPLADVHWEPAVVIEKPGSSRKDAGTLKVGLRDGRVLPLRAFRSEIARKLALYDVVYVRVQGDKGKGARADLRVRPLVQGAAIVLDNKAGRILAMAGGFSYGLSQLNRTAQTRRQPGSSIKPLTYLAALQHGLQPNTLVRDESITLPPIVGDREKDYWTPKNYDGGASGVTTLRRALENSKNLATVGLLQVIASSPQESLNRVCDLMIEAQLYQECQRYYPVVLGAQPVRLIDLAAFYAAVANEGGRPAPHAIEAVEQDGHRVWRDDTRPVTWLAGADRISFYQLKTMLQGVLARGTARAIANLAPFVGGKTGTSDDENDAWFVGFTNDVTVAVWVGYDNANGRRTLGRGQTGGKVAVPVFEPIIKTVWARYAAQVALSPPSADVKRQIASLPIDLHSGDRVSNAGRGAFYEQFRIDGSGQFSDTQYDVVGRDEAETLRDRDTFVGSEQGYDNSGRYYGNYAPYYGARPGTSPYGASPYGAAPYGSRPYGNPPAVQYRPPPRGLFGGFFGEEPQRPSYDDRYNGERSAPGEEPEGRRPRRVDPDYFWGGRRYN